MSTKIKKEDIERLKNLALEAMRENATNRASLKLKHPNTRPNDIKEDIATAERVVEKIGRRSYNLALAQMKKLTILQATSHQVCLLDYTQKVY